MEILKKHKYLPIILLVIIFIVGLVVGYFAGRLSENDNETEATEETATEKEQYESHSTLYISSSEELDYSSSITSSDLATSQGLANTYAILLQRSHIRTAIDEKFPDTEYELSTEVLEHTQILRIIVTGDSPENLQEICDLAISLLCEDAANIIEGSSCKIIDTPSDPKRITDPM